MESHDYSSRSDKSIPGWRKKNNPSRPNSSRHLRRSGLRRLLVETPSPHVSGVPGKYEFWTFLLGERLQRLISGLADNFQDKKALRQFHFCRATVDNWLVLWDSFFFQVHHLPAHKAIGQKIKKLRRLATVSSICLTAILSRMNTITV